MQLIDTHCHIHSVDYPLDVAEAEQRAFEAGVTQFICVGTDAADSQRAVQFVQNRPNAWASVGLHPHDAKDGDKALQVLRDLVESDLGASQVSRESASLLKILIRTVIATPRVLPSDPPLKFFIKDKRILGAAPSDVTPGFATEKSLIANRPYVELVPRGLPVNEGLLSSEAVGGTEGGYATGPEQSEGQWEGDLSDRARGVAKSSSQNVNVLNYLEEVVKTQRKIVAIGECGLDYFYDNSPKKDQEKALRYQIELALEHNLPLIFHIRGAFSDFWPIFDSYKHVRGIIHSFTDTRQNLDELLARNLLVGVNGIITFTKNDWQLEVAKAIPFQNLVLETDAPFLTPVPYRGTVNEPARVRVIAKFLANLRGESPEAISEASTQNARQLFSI